jgi:Transposase DDE domain
MQRIGDHGIQVLVPPDSELYRKRQPMIEPVFAQMKYNRGLDRFQRRGRGAVRTEWRLITATHNLRG